MTGRIKAGEGTLIGNAGEYYVMAELLKDGVIAAMASRNSPTFDILAVKNGKNIGVRVKTKSDGIPDWQYNVKKDGTIFKGLTTTSDYTVLVNLAKSIKNQKYYIVPTHIVNAWLIESHQEWLDTPGKKGQPHSGENKKRHLSYKKYEKQLKKYCNKWNLLWK